MTTSCYGDTVAEFGRLGAATVDLIVTRPPYNRRIAYGADEGQRAWPDYYAWMETVLGACRRVLHPGGTLMGSATTGVAAGQLGRAFWGCERQPTYSTVARARCGDAGGAV